MTASQVRRVTREWGVVATLAILTIGIAILFALLIPALGRISDQASAGDQAKRRQCQLSPISLKVYRQARRDDVITKRDLAKFKKSTPRECGRFTKP